MNVEKVLRGARHSLLYGPPGTGKTTLAQKILGEDAANVTLNGDVSVQELLGHYVPKGDKFEWHDGPILSAFRHGKGLILNEVVEASEMVQISLLAILDGPEVAKLTTPTGETLKFKEGFKCILTTNGLPEDLPEALSDRLDVMIKISEPLPDIHIALSQNFTPALADAVVKSYKNPRNCLPPRSFFTYARLAPKIGKGLAVSSVFGPRAGDVETLLKTTNAWTVKNV